MKVEKITDVKVKIDVLQPQPTIGMGNPAIFNQGEQVGDKAYKSLASIKEDFSEDSGVYKKAAAVFAQANAPKTVHVITYAEGKIEEAAAASFFTDWHFALLAEFDADNALALSNFIEEQEFKFFVVQVDKVADLTPLSGNTATIGLVHPLDEAFDGALIGNAASLPVGSITWKFRSNLIGITAQPLTVAGLEAIHEAYGIAYVEKAGIAQTSEGTTLSGEFIDALHGTHWVKANMESSIQNVLSTTDKLTFDSRGIDLLNVTATNILETAFQQGIILADGEGKGDYAVTTLSRDDLDPADIAARNYKGLSFSYKRSGAIHTVEVSGTVEV